MTMARMSLRVMALTAVMAVGVSCCPPVVAPVVVAPCPKLNAPPKPRLPIQDYDPKWSKDELLKAYSASTVLLNGWGDACATVIESHNNRAGRE
jgi:hypothetical protein